MKEFKSTFSQTTYREGDDSYRVWTGHAWRYNDNFKKMVVERVHRGENVRDLAIEYDVYEQTIYTWLRKVDGYWDRTPQDGYISRSKYHHSEVGNQAKEIKENETVEKLKRENEILRQAFMILFGREYATKFMEV